MHQALDKDGDENGDKQIAFNAKTIQKAEVFPHTLTSPKMIVFSDFEKVFVGDVDQEMNFVYSNNDPTQKDTQKVLDFQIFNQKPESCYLVLYSDNKLALVELDTAKKYSVKSFDLNKQKKTASKPKKFISFS